MISNRLKEGTKEYQIIKNLRVAFVVDECHRAVTPETKENWNSSLIILCGMDLPEHLF